MDTQESPQAAASVSSSIDLIARAAASALLVVYGLGFVILGFHDARYGVVQFSPFRTRIFLVGFVFAALVSLAAAAQHYGFVYIAPLNAVRADTDPARRKERETVLAGGFIFTACVMASVFNSFLFGSIRLPPPNRWHIIAWFGFYALAWTAFVGINKIFAKRPTLSVFLSLLSGGVFFAGVANLPLSETWSALAVFFALVGWETMAFKRSTDKLRHFSDFTNWIILLSVLWMYILGIFGNLHPRWGGGRPTPIQIFQNSATPGLPASPMDALLLDETDQGLYVLLSPTGKAFFIPRTNIATIFFGTKEELTKK